MLYQGTHQEYEADSAKDEEVESGHFFPPVSIVQEYPKYSQADQHFGDRGNKQGYLSLPQAFCQL
jgi:hypothetical protein